MTNNDKTFIESDSFMRKAEYQDYKRQTLPILTTKALQQLSSRVTSDRNIIVGMRNVMRDEIFGNMVKTNREQSKQSKMSKVSPVDIKEIKVKFSGNHLNKLERTLVSTVNSVIASSVMFNVILDQIASMLTIYIRTFDLQPSKANIISVVRDVFNDAIRWDSGSGKGLKTLDVWRLIHSVDDGMSDLHGQYDVDYVYKVICSESTDVELEIRPAAVKKIKHVNGLAFNDDGLMDLAFCIIKAKRKLQKSASFDDILVAIESYKNSGEFLKWLGSKPVESDWKLMRDIDMVSPKKSSKWDSSDSFNTPDDSPRRKDDDELFKAKRKDDDELFKAKRKDDELFKSSRRKSFSDDSFKQKKSETRGASRETSPVRDVHRRSNSQRDAKRRSSPARGDSTPRSSSPVDRVVLGVREPRKFDLYDDHTPKRQARTTAPFNEIEYDDMQPHSDIAPMKTADGTKRRKKKDTK